ncbi:hypothetical protein C3941_17205 [Kaistia algarum]|uniref:CHASE2 domain-containing protein n=1 Tax=Kaistia algarum TaxID=2083279 RepID=UPI000CE8B1F7|nr:CHASE2 domain-containing protein [Kaistia algarum]MCX5516299.1 CHASE2 domain-containing protein [Kaistia algarum]PPE78780.1 hypothetical protein C3941_17205 [Kaistia algarum]
MRIAALGAWNQLGSWKTRHPVLFELSISILLGILIEIALLAFQPPTLLIVRRVADDTADRMIRLAERTTDRIAASPAFTFLDIDDATWAEWGWPLVTPRGKIEALLERVAGSGPLAILLDVDLAFPGDKDEEASLHDFLAAYAPTSPPLVLVRSMIDTPSGKLPLLRPTDYDDAVAGKANIVFASPLFERDGDGKIRRWRLLAEACEGNRPMVVPSMHLAGAMIARQAIHGPPPGVPAPALQRMDRNLAAFVPANCAARAVEREGELDDWPASIPIAVAPEDVSKRVIYRVGWEKGTVGLGPLVDSPAGGETQLVAVRPARLALAADPGAPLPGIAGRIVIIGGSFSGSGDWHDTPIGRMPGSLLLVNAVEALTQNGTPREPSAAERLAISLMIIVAASLLTSFLRPTVAAWALAFGIVLLMIVSIGRFKSGVMLDLAVPAVGAVMHDIGESLIAMARDIRAQGWRWILKSHGHARPIASGHDRDDMQHDVPSIGEGGTK